jgi:ribosomal protein L40E
MSSSRSKLMLDEQSFQGLLAAAFTIQQHNDRQKAVASNSTVGSEEASVQPSTDVCRNCGAPIPAGRAACPKCGADSFRPGERLQRTWASMWLMSQEKNLAPDLGPGDREKTDRDVQSLRPGPGASARDRAHFPAAFPSPVTKAQPASPQLIEEVRREATDSVASRSRSIRDAFMDASNDNVPRAENAGTIEKRKDAARSDASNTPWRPNDPLVNEDEPIENTAVANAAPRGFLSDDLRNEEVRFEIAAAQDLPMEEPPVLGPSSSADAIRQGLCDLRVKLRFHRADLYLGVAVVVAFLALLWPAVASQQPKLRPWERMLVAIGIAEAPAPAVHYSGNPNIKVWVDTHTALYYCPGEEFYGKSQDGHFSTQRDAQLDRFEPAERLPCE